jgi:hypothetical protein
MERGAVPLNPTAWLFPGGRYDKSVYYILNAINYETANTYYVLSGIKNNPLFTADMIMRLPTLEAHNFIYNISFATIMDFLNFKPYYPSIHSVSARYASQAQLFGACMRLSQGAPYLAPRLRRARVAEPHIKILSGPFTEAAANNLCHFLNDWGRHIIQTPHYVYGRRPNISAMDDYLAILNTENPFEKEMIRQAAEAETVYFVTRSALYAACMSGNFYMVFDDIREYRALYQWLVNHAFGIYKTDPIYQELKKVCATYDFDPSVLLGAFNPAAVHNALYNTIRYTYIIELVAQK